MEKKKIRKFYGYIAFLICFCIAIAGYVFVSDTIARYNEAQAVIAQAQPAIEIAKGQRAIDNAIAAQTMAITFESVILSILPYIVLIVYIVYDVYKKERGHKNEEIQPTANINYTANN